MSNPLGNAGPLTTTYIPPPSCFTPLFEYYDDINYSIRGAYYGNTCQTQQRLRQDVSSCYPPNFIAIRSRREDTSIVYHSPGLVCPASFVSACTFVRPGDGSPLPTTQGYVWEKELAGFRNGETVIGCCPTGYSCNSDSPFFDCVSPITSGQTVSATECISFVTAGVLPATATHTFTTDGVATASASAVLLVRPGSDPPAAQTAVPGDSTTGDTGAGGGNSANDGSAGLSRSGSIAVGLCVPLAVLLLAAAALLLRRRSIRRRRIADLTEIDPTQEGHHAGAAEWKAELDGATYAQFKTAAYEPGSAVHGGQTDTSPSAPELEARSVVRERLPARPDHPTAFAPPDVYSPAYGVSPGAGGLPQELHHNVSRNATPVSPIVTELDSANQAPPLNQHNNARSIPPPVRSNGLHTPKLG